MFACIFTLLPLALLASASHLEARDTCNSGSVNCCNSVQSYGSTSSILALAGVLLDVDPATMLGFGCSPIQAVAVGGGNSCTQQTACCENTKFNGVINIGCSPINVNA